jgi:hypothetical protein
MIFDDWEEKSVNLNVPKSLLWDVDLENVDWHGGIRKLLVERVLERGEKEDFYAVIGLYGGLDNFREIIKEIHYLSDRNIAFACTVFNLKKEELRCYKRMQLRKKHLLS